MDISDDPAQLQRRIERLLVENELLRGENERLQRDNETIYSLAIQNDRRIAEAQRRLEDSDRLFDQIGVASITLDRDLRIRRYNQRAAALLDWDSPRHGRHLKSLPFKVHIGDPLFGGDTPSDLPDDSRADQSKFGPIGSMRLDDELRRVLSGQNVESREVYPLSGDRVFWLQIVPLMATSEELSLRDGDQDVMSDSPRHRAARRSDVISGDGVVLMLTDISEMKVFQRPVARWSEIVQQSADAILRVDNRGRIRTWNRGAELLFGYDLSIIGRSIETLFASETSGAADDKPHITPTRRVMECIAGLHVDDGLRKFRCIGRTATDDRINADVSVSPIHEAGRILGGIVIIQDATKQFEAEMTIRENVIRRDEFLAMLSHELRNPLGAIVNAARIIEAVGGDANQPGDSSLSSVADAGVVVTDDEESAAVFHSAPGDAATGVNADTAHSPDPPDTELHRSDDLVSIGVASRVIVRQSHQMARLLDDLLDVSRVTLGKLELKRSGFDLRTVVEQSIRVLQPQFDEHELTFQYVPCDQPLMMFGDFARLQQVVVNLLRNSIKYTPAKGLIALSVQRFGSTAEIQVRDTGVGINPGMQKRIFDMFVQASHTLDRSQGGIGLGLTLVRSVAELHRGSVSVYSEGIGHGSEFTVRLPLTQIPNATTKPASVPRKIETIVVVEDVVDACDMMKSLLEMMGYQVSIARDGNSGYELIRETRPDMALVDIGLPGIDGYEIARRIRRDPQTETLRLVALTGYGQESDRRKVTEAGFDDHLVKPLNLTALQNTLQQ